MHAADSKEVDPPLPLDGLSWRGPRPQELDAVPRREFGGPMYEVPPDTLGSASGRNQDFVDLKSYAFSYLPPRLQVVLALWRPETAWSR